jgi:hypothetical protein
MTSQKSHAEKVYQARTKALRAPATKLYRVSVESIMAVEDTLVEATTLRQAIEKLVAARHSELKLDPKSWREYTNDRNLPEAQMKMRRRYNGVERGWTVWAVEAEVLR